MEISILLARQIASMLLIVITGFCTVRFGLFNERDTAFLARLAIFIVCPCAIINSFQMEFSMEKLAGLVLAAVVTILLHIIYIFLDRFLRRPLKLTPVESASVIYSNALNLILPLVVATLGEDMVFYCMAYLLVQSFLMWTHGKSLVSGEVRINPRDFLNPNIIAIVAGLLLFVTGLPLPEIPRTSIRNVGNMIGPMSMLVNGMLIGKMDIRRAFLHGRTYFIACLRLIVFPAITVLVLVYSGLMRFHPDSRNIFLVTLLAASSCSAASISQMAAVYSDDGSYAGMLGLVNLVLCIITMPLIVLLYQVLAH